MGTRIPTGSSCDPRHVVTVFLEHEGRILLVRRSQHVGTHRGLWAGISGYLEHSPIEQALVEIREETGLETDDVEMLREARPIEIPDPDQNVLWIVHPFLVRVKRPDAIRLDWENVEKRWIRPEEIGDYDETVPGLADTLRGCLESGVEGLDAAARALIEEIRNDRSRGAGELARRCLAGIADHARDAQSADTAALLDDLRELAAELQRTRPTMAPIRNLIERWLEAMASLDAVTLEVASEKAVSHAHALITESEQAVDRAAMHAAKLIGPGRTIITHSLSSTVVRVFKILGPRAQAIITESRPPGEGRQLAASLSALGIAADFITDQQMGHFAGRADAALVGADTVAADGSVVNKAGTYLLALAARDRNVPFYVCFEELKRSNLDAANIPLEEHDPAEHFAQALAGIRPRNVYFDVTPARLITAWITEAGVMPGSVS